MALVFLFLLGGTEAIAERGLQEERSWSALGKCVRGPCLCSVDPSPHVWQIIFPLILLLMLIGNVSSFCLQLLGGFELQVQAAGATCSSRAQCSALG